MNQVSVMNESCIAYAICRSHVSTMYRSCVNHVAHIEYVSVTKCFAHIVWATCLFLSRLSSCAASVLSLFAMYGNFLVFIVHAVFACGHFGNGLARILSYAYHRHKVRKALKQLYLA